MHVGFWTPIRRRGFTIRTPLAFTSLLASFANRRGVCVPEKRARTCVPGSQHRRIVRVIRARSTARMTTIEGQPDCIFCKIIRGELPSYNVYSDETCVAFLDLFPATAGHTLLVPRAHHELIDTMAPDQVAALFARVPDLGKAVKSVVGAVSYNLLVNNGREAGQVVPHVHVHIIPRKPGDGLIRHPGGGPRLDPESAEPLVRALKQKLAHSSAN